VLLTCKCGLSSFFKGLQTSWFAGHFCWCFTSRLVVSMRDASQTSRAPLVVVQFVFFFCFTVCGVASCFTCSSSSCHLEHRRGLCPARSKVPPIAGACFRHGQSCPPAVVQCSHRADASCLSNMEYMEHVRARSTLFMMVT
jgi:hypothetical protein